MKTSDKMDWKKDKLPEKKLQDDEKIIFLKYFLQRFHNRETTPKEENVVASLKKLYNPEKNRKGLTDRELARAVGRNRREIMKKTKERRYSERKSGKTIRLIPLFIGSGAAAIALLIFLFSAPFIRNMVFVDTSLISETNPVIEKQFTTGNEIKKILLTDGSSVFLNQGTTISLRKGKFNAHTREIWLDEGEAFFIVEKVKDCPFIVHTPNGIKTQALGTSFNIRAYSELDEQVISVNTGRVHVYDEEEHTIFLDPDHKVSVKTGSNAFTAGKTDAESVSAWQSGTIVLEEATIREVALRLKQAFNIDLIYGNTVRYDEKIVTSFTINTPPEEALAIICKLYNVHYKRNDNTVELIK